MTRQKSTREITRDTLFDGRIVCSQFMKGYRFSIDSVLLGHFIRPRTNDHILELGSGCGVIGLILLFRHKQKRLLIKGIEIQPDLVALSQQNVVDNGFGSQFDIIEGDIKQIASHFKPESFSQVIANPPYYLENSGRLSTNKEAMAARHQGDASLTDFVKAAAFSVRNKGRVHFIYPVDFVSELFAGLRRERIEPKRIQFVYPYPEKRRGAKLILLEGIKNGGIGMKVASPLYIHQGKGGPYSEDVNKMFVYKP